MKKILIVDDASENLEAARIAAQEFSEHEFIFCNQAAEAYRRLSEVDGVVSDLFFPEEMDQDLIIIPAFAGMTSP